MKRIYRYFAMGMLVLVAAILQTRPTTASHSSAQGINPDPPDHVVRLVFIHHSCGENWLNDEDGRLALELGRNNYFVSDTNYGWGPDSIGDRTDIPDWLEWFRGLESERYLTALYTENERNSEYSRTLNDPEGENEVILFKSCFPNSNLEGNPGDPPAFEADYTVGGAKYVYNQLLRYFENRPDKLFVVITAPPVSDRSYAANARDFNNWLVYDWLDENGYAYSNVAVFDFYNLLTGEGNHHRVSGGGIEHTSNTGRDTAYYTSDDDHPSSTGNRKATQEFVPLLNVFYHRWQENVPAQPFLNEAPGEALESESPPIQQSIQGTGIVDDFEGGALSGTSGWEPAWDASTSTTITCALSSEDAYAGGQALQVEFDVATESWATCGLFFDALQDWSSDDGLTFFMRATQPGVNFELNLYATEGDQQESYQYGLTTSGESTETWVPLTVRWTDLQRVEWEENAGETFAKPERVQGLAFGFSATEDAPNTGMIWIDDLHLIRGESVDVQEPPESEGSSVENPRQLLPCGGSATPLLAAALVWGLQRRRTRKSAAQLHGSRPNTGKALQ
jgi:hypothetical protein